MFTASHLLHDVGLHIKSYTRFKQLLLWQFMS